MRRLVEEDEELAAVGTRPLVGHAHDAALVVTQRRQDLILERGSINRAPALWVLWGRRVGRSSSLHHEARYQSVEGRLIVVVRRAQSEEILGVRQSRVSGVLGKAHADILTSAVLGTLSQNTSILRSPRVVCNVTDMVCRDCS